MSRNSHQMIRLSLLVVAFAPGLILLAGCGGYSLESPFPSDVKTVAVPVWNRGADVYRRDEEIRLTGALVRRIEQDTPYKVVHDRGRADTEITGTIESIDQQVLSRNPDTGLPRELAVTYNVSFVWKDLRTGEIRAREPNLAVTGTYISHEPLGEDFFVGSQDVINKLARRIVERMERPW